MKEIMQANSLKSGRDSIPYHCYGKSRIILFDRESDVIKWLNHYWPSYIESDIHRFKFGQKPIEQIFNYTIKKQKVQL